MSHLDRRWRRVAVDLGSANEMRLAKGDGDADEEPIAHLDQLSPIMLKPPAPCIQQAITERTKHRCCGSNPGASGLIPLLHRPKTMAEALATIAHMESEIRTLRRRLCHL